MADYAKGDVLMELRKKTGLTREKAAAELGFTTKTLFTWEKENGGIRPDNARKLAEFYGVEDPATLLTSTEAGGDQLDRIEEKIDQLIKRTDDLTADAIERDELVAALLAALREQGNGGTARDRKSQGQ